MLKLAITGGGEPGGHVSRLDYLLDLERVLMNFLVSHEAKRRGLAWPMTRHAPSVYNRSDVVAELDQWACRNAPRAFATASNSAQDDDTQGQIRQQHLRKFVFSKSQV